MTFTLECPSNARRMRAWAPSSSSTTVDTGAATTTIAGWTLLVEPWEAVRASTAGAPPTSSDALPGDGALEPYVAVVAGHLPLPEQSLGE